MGKLKDNIKKWAPYFVDIWQYLVIIVVIVIGLIFFV